MNRRERRRQKKSGGASPPLRKVVRPASVSDMLLGLAGVRGPVQAAPPDKLPEDPVHSALAQMRLNQGLAVELGKLEQALRENPDSEALLHSVARLQLRLDRRADALLTFRRLLAIKPDHAEAAHMIGILSGAAPEKPDAAYIADMFDQYADTFDEKLTHWLDYQAPQQVAAAARAALGEDQKVRRAIDLGCGTGLLGPEVRDLAERLDGVDLSSRMIEKAKARGSYDELIVGEIIETLQGRNQAYDLILAADVLAYFGDLRPLLSAVCASLHEGGVFVATVEKGADGRYQADKTGRYQHGESYLRKRAAEAGFVLLSLEEVTLRREENRPVQGYVFALRRLAADTETDAAPAAMPALSVDDLLASLETPGAAIAAAAAQHVVSSERPVGWAIDLGGCMGRYVAELRRLAQHIDMITPDADRTRQLFEAGVYDDTDTGDIIPFLEARPDHYDLIVAADVSWLNGDIALLFSAVKIALALAGAFIAVVPASRYDEAALRDMVKAEGLIVLALEPVTLTDGSAGFCVIAES